MSIKWPFGKPLKKGFSMFIHQTLESNWYLEHRPVFLQPPQVCLQSRDKGLHSRRSKRAHTVDTRCTHGGHGGHTHESGADDGRGLNPETCFARKHLSSKAILSPLVEECARGIHRLLSGNVKPLSFPAPATGVDRLSIPHTSIRLPAPQRPEFAGEKKPRLSSVRSDIIRWRRYSEVFISGKLGRVSACLVCRVRAGG